VRIEPAHLRHKADDLVEDQHDTDEQNAEDETVEPRICHEGSVRLAIKDRRDEADQDQEDDHRPQEVGWIGELVAIAAATRFRLVQIVHSRIHHVVTRPPLLREASGKMRRIEVRKRLQPEATDRLLCDQRVGTGRLATSSKALWICSLPATTFPLPNMSVVPLMSLVNPPASRIRMIPAAMSQADR